MFKNYISILVSKIRGQYFNQIPKDEREYLKSRRAFTIDGVSSVIILTFISGAYLSGFLKYIGVPDELNGVINAIPSLVSFASLFGALYTQRLVKRKLFVCSYALMHRLMFSLLYIIPFLISDATIRVIAVITMMSIAYFMSAFISPAASNWIVSLVPNAVRGRYFSARELITTVAYSAASLIIGYGLDYFKDVEKFVLGYILLGIFIFINTIINIIALSTAKEPQQMVSSHKTNVLKALGLPFINKDYRAALVALVMWTIAIQTAVPYFGLFLINDLKLSYVFISFVIFLNGLSKAAFVRYWGKRADRHSWANVLKHISWILGVTYFGMMCLTQGNASWLYPLTAMISAISWSSAGITIFNIQYDYAPSQDRMLYVGASSAILGIIGFATVFMGAAIVRYISENPLNINGINIVAEQILLFISAIILVITSAFVKFFLENKQRVVNLEDGRAAE